jgi:hypothetical protein
MKYFKIYYLLIIFLLGCNDIKKPKDNLKFNSESNFVNKQSKDKTDEQVLNELIKIINSNDLQLFDKIYPSELNKQDKLIDVGNKTLKVINRRTIGVDLFGGVARSLSFYFHGVKLIMLETAPAELTFSKIKFDEVIKSAPIYSLVVEQGNMTIYNEYFIYDNIIINTWRPIKKYEFKNNGVIDNFTYTPNDIFFLTITRKNVFEEMIEPKLKN